MSDSPPTPEPGPNDEGGPGHLAQLRAETSYLKQRRDLYRAKAHGPRPTRLSRLRELEREYELAASRLSRAERERGQDVPPDSRR